MARKRKALRTFEQPQTAKLTKFNIEERFSTSEDEFYAGRDKILLEESADSKRRHRIAEREKDLQPSDEEVLGYQDEDDSEGQDYSDVSEGHGRDLHGTAELAQRSNSTRLAHGEADQDEDGISEDEHWGANRADYYAADVIETEADALEEENEAKRLHQKQIKSMTEADFGFDENEWAEQKKAIGSSNILTEKLPEVRIPQDVTDQQKLQILQNRYPELRLLAEDFLRLQRRKDELDEQVFQISQQMSQGRRLARGLPVTAKRDALTAYMASISMYFAIISSNTSEKRSQSINAMPPLELHEHAIIQTLTTVRQLWDRVAQEETAGLEPIRAAPAQNASQVSEPQVNGTRKKFGTNGVRADMMTNTRRESMLSEGFPIQKTKGGSARSKPEELSGKKKSRKPNLSSGGKRLDLDTLMKEVTTENVDSESDFGDEYPLTEEQYAEKDRKRKSLRFYTSQIASKANKRGHASREAGGDDDLPHKERQRDRQERLMKAAEARGKQALDTFDDGAGDDGYDEVSNHRRQDENDEYYNTLLNATNRKKSDKKAKAEAYAAAAREGAQVYEQEVVKADGKRAITYAIAKNKGLAPKRKKDVRNPRVKKRKKFDEKLKKLGSMKQVYKGGEGRGGYGGEMTGIKTNVVKSVKL